MSQQVFQAATLREAIQLVQRALGPDAVILRTREVAEGHGRSFEVVARGPAQTAAAPPSGAAAAAKVPSAPAAASPTPWPPEAAATEVTQAHFPDASGFPSSAAQASPSAAMSEPSAEPPSEESAPPPVSDERLEGGAAARRQLTSLRGELDELRSLAHDLNAAITAPEELRNDVAVLAQSLRVARRRGLPDEPLAVPLIRAGVDAPIARAIVARARARVAASDGASSLTPATLEAELARCFRTTEPLWARSERTVAALIGPAGAGKTTAVAKIAAESAFVHRKRVALVSTAARHTTSFAALRAYGEAFEIPVLRATDAVELLRVLQDLSQCDLVLVDTEGTNPWNPSAHDALDARLDGSGVERHVVAPATWRSDALRDLMRAYERGGISSLIISRTDEARSLGAVITATWNCPHPLSHVGSSDEVPGGIVPACGRSIARAVLRSDSAQPEQTPIPAHP